jgi:cellulose synthase/poly-beta-1,6-N-acetylglucosamine synthase-like glycosyltransferase
VKDTSSKITIVVPFRNISDDYRSVDVALAECVRSLQLISECVEEVVFVNDHSTDDSKKHLSECSIPNLRILDLKSEFNGKKAALELGVKEAKTEYIWTLDADVVITQFSSKRFKEFEKQLEKDLVIMPVYMNSGNSLLEQLQTNEWRYLQFITWLSSEVKLPMMCNGANLIFRREVFIENIEAHRSISSGDDMFLLSRVMKFGGEISMCWEKFGRVEISTVNSWRESIVQRIRWAGKITKLPSTKASVLHVLFALISAIHVLAFIGLFVPSWHLESAVFLSIKVLTEVLCMYGVFSNRMKMKEIVLALPQMVLYPFFSLFIFISSLFFIPKWKGRRVSLK